MECHQIRNPFRRKQSESRHLENGWEYSRETRVRGAVPMLTVAVNCRSLKYMARLILLTLLALSIVGLGGQSVAAASVACSMPEVMMTMDGDSGDHDAMGCCTPECALTVSPVAFLLEDSAEPHSIARAEITAADAIGTPNSIDPLALDPPPRHLHL
jgi:hypothetical protein